VLGFTTLIVYSFWSKFSGQVSVSPYVKIIAASLLSIGLYRLVASIFLYLFKKIRLVRKFFLGGAYVEGTWVGFYIGVSGKVRYIVERFEQDFETLIVRGIAYNEKKELHVNWVSFPANIDLQKGEMNYMYDLKGIHDVTNGTGIVSFNFKRKSSTSPPDGISGFSADLHNEGFRTKSLEYKLSDNFETSDKDALAKAMGFYELNEANY